MSLSCSVLTFYPVPSPERLLPIPSCCPSRSSLSGNPEIARFSSFLSGRACVPTFKLSQSPGLFFSQIQIILPLNCHRNTPRRGCTHRVPRGPFCQLCLQRGHCLSRCPLREGLMFLGHVSMMLQLPNEPEEPGRISRPSDYTHNRPNWRRRRRWLNASRRVRERIARRRGSMVGPDVQLYYQSRTDIHASTIMPAAATMQLFNRCHLRLSNRIHEVQSVWQGTHP